MQKAIIVRYRFREDRQDFSVRDLNELLADGWRVAQVSPMGGAPLAPAQRRSLYAVFACLVIVEKEDEP